MQNCRVKTNAISCFLRWNEISATTLSHKYSSVSPNLLAFWPDLVWAWHGVSQDHGQRVRKMSEAFTLGAQIPLGQVQARCQTTNSDANN